MAGGKQHPELSESAREELLRNSLYEPLGPYPGQSKPWKVRCLRCNREVFQRVIALEAAQAKRVASGFGNRRTRCNHLGARTPGPVRPVALTVEEAVAIRDMVELARQLANQSGPPELGAAMSKLQPLLRRADRP